MRSDPLAPRAILCAEDLAFDERFDGASFAGVRDGLAIAQYLQLVIQSSVFLHALLMLDGQFGVEREVVHLATILDVPVVPWADLTSELRAEADALSGRLRSGHSMELLSEIDYFASGTFGPSNVQREAIADTLATALPTAAVKQNAVRLTTPEDRSLFAAVCERELRSVLAALGETAVVTERSPVGRITSPAHLRVAPSPYTDGESW